MILAPAPGGPILARLSAPRSDGSWPIRPIAASVLDGGPAPREHSPVTDTHETSERPLLSADRLKAFTDGVVAIAMTLLILPLMEGVIDLGREGRSVLEYLGEDYGQLISFVMSFVLIASFWISHHRVFDRVEHTSGPLI